jgi:L-asparaginase II
VEPLHVELRRGGTVESRHLVHAAAVRDGRLVAGCGDVGRLCFLRSAAKPLQALVLADARPDLGPRELAIACSSHAASPAQLDAVRALLRAGDLDPASLECTAADDQLAHMCSGKHAGMLVACVANGWPTDGYREADHPLQRAIRGAVARAAGLREGSLLVGVDGCGVPTFGVELQRAAAAFASLGSTRAGAAVVAAMRAHPELIAAPDEPDRELMTELPGWIAKTGVEGVLVAAGPDGTALALKVEDGNPRALAPALAALLGRLGYASRDATAVPIVNSHGVAVGDIAAA